MSSLETARRTDLNQPANVASTDRRRGAAEVADHSCRDAVERRLARDGFVVLNAAVPQHAAERALRCLHLDLLRRGLTATQIADWHAAKCWFPHLRWEPAILALLDHLPQALREGTLCEPQILLHLPDEAEEWPTEPHTDQPPPWADGRAYCSIVGVALSPARAANGGLIVWPFHGDGPVPVELATGDAVVMHPRIGHSGGLNREGMIRYCVYFRFLDS